MTRIDPRLFETAFVKPGTPSFADLLAALSGASELTDTRRRDLASGLRRVAKALGRSPDDIPADPTWLQPRLEKIAPAALGLSPKSWSNAMSDARAAMAHVGIVHARRHRFTDLSPCWRLLWDRILAADDRSLTCLGRFVHFLDRLGVAPEEVTQDHAEAFLSAVTQNEISRSPETAYRNAVYAWNRAVDRVQGWPRQKLTLQSRSRQIALPVADFPASFAADLERYLGGLARPDPFDPDALARPLSPDTIEQRRGQILRFASILVQAGQPIEAIDGLAALVAPEAAEAGLRRMLARNEGSTSVGIADIASMLKGIARRHVRLPEAGLKRIDRMAARLAMPPKQGMTVKNRARLRPLEDPATLKRLLLLPETVFRRADRPGPRRYRDLLDRETALAIAILLVCPVRRKNLAGIHLERSLQRPGDGRLFLVFEAAEVKNDRRIEFELPKSLIAMIDAHLATRAPVLCPHGVPWLFPRRDGSASFDPQQLAQNMQKLIRRETGLEMNAHPFRHLAAMIWLDAHPGHYEAARRLLGHAELGSTLNAYAGFEAGTATRLFAELVEAARRG